MCAEFPSDPRGLIRKVNSSHEIHPKIPGLQQFADIFGQCREADGIEPSGVKLPAHISRDDDKIVALPVARRSAEAPEWIGRLWPLGRYIPVASLRLLTHEAHPQL